MIKRKKGRPFYYLPYMNSPLKSAITAEEINKFYKPMANDFTACAKDFGGRLRLRQIESIAYMRFMRLN